MVMVGEIRDLETAEISIKAAQTGHMVLSTLHTNSAAETLTRLRNMGVEAFNVATAVSLIIAQRLARRLCEECKVSYTIPESALLEAGFDAKELHKLNLFEPNSVGFNKCTKGYKGRVGIYEVLSNEEDIQKMIVSNATSDEIQSQAIKDGMVTMQLDGLIKAMIGMTSIEEILRVTRE